MREFGMSMQIAIQVLDGGADSAEAAEHLGSG
jgi:hypothetical protein